MKLTSARIYLIESGGIRPVLLELETDVGITGLGEACVAYGIGGTGAAYRRTIHDWHRPAAHRGAVERDL